MFDNIYENLDNLIKVLNNNKKVTRMIELKNEINSDKDIKIKIDNFRKIQSNSYSNEYVLLKKEILSNKLISEYKDLENELFIVILNINKELNSLVGKKGCN